MIWSLATADDVSRSSFPLPFVSTYTTKPATAALMGWLICPLTVSRGARPLPNAKEPPLLLVLPPLLLAPPLVLPPLGMPPPDGASSGVGAGFEPPKGTDAAPPETASKSWLLSNGKK